MNTLSRKQKVGIRVLTGFGILLNIMYLLGQTMAFINYDFTVSIELQEPVTEITAIGVALNKGFGVGDTFFYMPLFIIGIIGLLKRNTWGVYAMFGAMAITVYWPIVCLATVFFAKGAQGWHFTDYTAYSILLLLIAVYGLWGLWFLFKNRRLLIRGE